jgi:hypothetical protein
MHICLAVQAAGAGDHLEQYNLWVQESRGLLSRLLFGELGPDILTHALIVRVEHNHTQTPPFKVGPGRVPDVVGCDVVVG